MPTDEARELLERLVATSGPQYVGDPARGDAVDAARAYLARTAPEGRRAKLRDAVLNTECPHELENERRVLQDPRSSPGHPQVEGRSLRDSLGVELCTCRLDPDRRCRVHPDGLPPTDRTEGREERG